MRWAVGTTSRKSCMRLATSSAVKKFTPVALPPGRLRLPTSPALTGSPVTPNTIGIVAVAALAASAPVPLPGTAITLTPRCTKSAASSANRAFGEAFEKSGYLLGPLGGRAEIEESDHRHRRLLCAC